jgi:hypothetical protein
MHASLKYSTHLACLPHHISLFKSFACIVLFFLDEMKEIVIFIPNTEKRNQHFHFYIFFRCEKEKFNFIEMNSTKKMYKMRSNEFQFTKNTFISFSQKRAVKKVFKNVCLAGAV